MKNHYIYEGSVSEFGKVIDQHWIGETWATSEGKARSNLMYQYKKKKGLTPNRNIKLDGKVRTI